MECFYLPDLNKTSKEFVFSSDEINHLKVLRIANNDICMATNGAGLTSIGVIEIQSKKYLFQPKDYFENFGEIDTNITVGFGVLSIKDRNEFLIEKCVELGVNCFLPLATRYVQSKGMNIEKFQLKIAAAMKQSKRSYLPIIKPVIDLKKIDFTAYDCVLLADENGDKEISSICKNVLILVGPEGGFHESEVEMLEKIINLQKLNLGPNRLRAETAAINLVSIYRQRYI